MTQMTNPTFAEDLATLREMPSQAKAWAENTLEYYKLDAIEKVATTTASIAGKMLSILIAVIALMFLSTAGSIALGYLFNNMALGFLAVGGIYLILALIFFFIRGNFVEIPITNSIIQVMTASDNDGQSPQKDDLNMPNQFGSNVNN